MLKRKAYSEFSQWRQSPSRRALLVTGARQIGKTFLVRQFAQDNYHSIVEINFALDESAKAIFSNGGTAEEILARISLFASAPMEPGETLVFLDEIQEIPEAITQIKGLVDRSGFDFVLSGSLLGTELKEVRSNPVGYVSNLTMYPLDFEEFCWAKGVSQETFDSLRACFHDLAPVDDFTNDHFHKLFREYLVVGGMPDAVQTYVASNDLSATRNVHEGVKSWYRTDISKYCPDKNKLKAKEAFDLVPSELNNPNKRFVMKSLNETARFREYEDAFLWLTYANVALAAYNITEPVSPLLVSKTRNLFKLFYSDTGILMSSFSRKASLDILGGSGEINHGAAYENAVAQELVAHGFSLYYYNSKKLGEVDFVVEDRDGLILPIEVKSGKSYKRHRAIENIMNVSNYQLKHGYVLCNGNMEQDGGIIYLPIYMIAFFENR